LALEAIVLLGTSSVPCRVDGQIVRYGTNLPSIARRPKSGSAAHAPRGTARLATSVALPSWSGEQEKRAPFPVD